MTRIAFQLAQDEADYRAAASRIRDMQIVEHGGEHDALVSDRVSDSDKPTLLVGATPTADTHFPAMPWRFCPHASAIRKSLDAGQLGRPGLLRLHRWESAGRGATHPARVAAVELTLWLIGEVPDAEHVVRNPSSEILHLGFPSGAMAILDFTDSLPDADGYRSLSLIGSLGAAYADDHRDRNLLFAGGAPRASPPESHAAALQPMLEDYVSAVREGRSPDSATGDLNRAQEIVQRRLS